MVADTPHNDNPYTIGCETRTWTRTPCIENGHCQHREWPCWSDTPRTMPRPGSISDGEAVEDEGDTNHSKRSDDLEMRDLFEGV